MSEIQVYGFEDEDGVPDGYTTLDPNEARERAARYGLALIAHTYEWQDDEMLDDFRPADR